MVYRVLVVNSVSWTWVPAEDAPLCAGTGIVALWRIEVGVFVMLNYGVHYRVRRACH